MPRIGGAIDVPQVADPATPAVGRQFFYFKSDGLLYTKKSDGTVNLVGSSSAGSTTTVIDGGALPDETYTGVVASAPPANMVTTDTAQTLTGAKTYGPTKLLMANAAGTLFAEPYSDVNPPDSLERTLLAIAPAAPIAGESVEYTTDGKNLRMIAPDGTNTLIGPAPFVIPGRPTLVKLADENISSAPFVDVIDLAFPMLANTSYEIEGTLFWIVAAATTGWRWGVIGPGIALASIYGEYNSTSAAEAITTQQHANTALTPSMVALLTSPFAVVPNMLNFRGYIRNGATAGNLRVQFASELAGTAATVLRGSYMSYKQI